MANVLKMALIEAILSLQRRGWSQRRIARELAIDRETVARHLRKASDSSKPANAIFAEALAYHEAGHVVMAVLVDAPRRHVAISDRYEEPGFNGRTEFDWGSRKKPMPEICYGLHCVGSEVFEKLSSHFDEFTSVNKEYRHLRASEGVFPWHPQRGKSQKPKNRVLLYPFNDGIPIATKFKMVPESWDSGWRMLAP